MKNDRRTFLKLAGMAGFSVAGSKLFGETGFFQDLRPGSGSAAPVQAGGISIIVSPV